MNESLSVLSLFLCVTFSKLLDKLFEDSFWNQFSFVIFLEQQLVFDIMFLLIVK